MTQSRKLTNRQVLLSGAVAILSIPYSVPALAQGTTTATAQPCIITPFTDDAYSVLLDHFDGSTKGQVFRGISYTPSVNGLTEAISFPSGSWAEFAVPGWYSWTSGYNASIGGGAIELWIKSSGKAAGDFLTINWNNSVTAPSAGYVTHLGLDSNQRLTVGGWSSITGNPFDVPLDAPHTVIQPNVWTHIAYLWGGLSGTQLYVNGSLEATSSLNYYPALNSTVYLYLNAFGSNVLTAADELRVSKIARGSMTKCAG